MAVELRRSCEVGYWRLFDGRPDILTKGFYYRVPETTPCYPGWHNLWSAEWVQDEEFPFTPPVLGAATELPRTYTRGVLGVPVPPANPLGSRRCIEGGETFPPQVANRRFVMGVDERCWTNAGMNPPLAPPTMPDLWLRPEELAALADGAAVSEWPTAFKAGRSPGQSLSGFQPHKLAFGLNGLGSVRFQSNEALRWDPKIDLGSAYSLYVVSTLGRSTGGAGIFGPFLSDPDTVRGVFQRRFDRADWQDDQTSVVDATAIAAASSHAYSVRRRSDEVVLGLDDGVGFVALVNPAGVSGLDGLAVALSNPGLPNQRRCWISEVLVWFRLVDGPEHSQVIQYLKTRYALP
jgi:hypothetical protein